MQRICNLATLKMIWVCFDWRRLVLYRERVCSSSRCRGVERSIS